MTESKEFTYQAVASHNTIKDLHVVIHDKVYDISSFVDEHPGGEEVLLDVAGQDATETFEDVGHSDEAREILKGLQIGTLKREGGAAPKPQKIPASPASKDTSSANAGVAMYAIVLLGGIFAFGIYKYLQTAAGTNQ